MNHVKKYFRWYCFAGLVILLCLLASCGSNPDAEKIYRWKIQACVPESTSLYQGFLMPFVETLGARSGGRLQLAPFPAGSIVASSELLVATAEGVVECAMGATSYDTGLIPESYAACNLPYAWTDTDQPADFWYNTEEAWSILDRAYRAKNVKLVALLNPDDPLTFMTMFPVNRVSDFKGRLIRAAGGWSVLVDATGASQVNLGISDVYQGLERSVIEGVFMALSGLSDFKWNEIVKYVMMPPPLVTGGGTNVIVNLDAFNELPPELQKMFVETARETVRTYLIPFTERQGEKIRAESEAKGVVFITLPPSEVAAMRSAALEMWKNIEAINANTARQVELMRAYLDARGIEYPGRE